MTNWKPRLTGPLRRACSSGLGRRTSRGKRAKNARGRELPAPSSPRSLYTRSTTVWLLLFFTVVFAPASSRSCAAVTLLPATA
jgi:hypothetical protein